MKTYSLLKIVATLAWSIVLPAIVPAADPAQAPPQLLRLGVIDDSGSMHGERMATVRDEWLKIA